MPALQTVLAPAFAARYTHSKACVTFFSAALSTVARTQAPREGQEVVLVAPAAVAWKTITESHRIQGGNNVLHIIGDKGQPALAVFS